MERVALWPRRGDKNVSENGKVYDRKDDQFADTWLLIALGQVKSAKACRLTRADVTAWSSWP